MESRTGSSNGREEDGATPRWFAFSECALSWLHSAVLDWMERLWLASCLQAKDPNTIFLMFGKVSKDPALPELSRAYS